MCCSGISCPWNNEICPTKAGASEEMTYYSIDDLIAHYHKLSKYHNFDVNENDIRNAYSNPDLFPLIVKDFQHFNEIISN